MRKVIMREMQRLTSRATTTPSVSMRNMARKLRKVKNRNDIWERLTKKRRETSSEMRYLAISKSETMNHFTALWVKPLKNLEFKDLAK